MNERIERVKYRAEKVKKFAKKHEDALTILLKIAVIFGAGFTCGKLVEGRLTAIDLKKCLPDIMTRSGMSGVDQSFNWISDNVPEAYKLLEEHWDKYYDRRIDYLPVFLKDPFITRSFEMLSVGDLDKYAKQYRKFTSKK